MEVHFNNVTIVVEAVTPLEGYRLLCEILGKDDRITFCSDTFDTKGADGNDDNYRSTSELPALDDEEDHE